MRLIALSLIMFCMLGHAQESNNLSVLQSPGSYDDGFSIGVQYEHQNDLIYVGPEVYIFPNLHDLPYIHLIGRFGFNVLRLGNTNIFRFYVGVRAGGIARNWEVGYALLGAETGFDYFIDKWGIFVGFSMASDAKTDSKYWGNDDSHTVNSGFFRIGVRF